MDFSLLDLEEADGTYVYILATCCVTARRKQPFPCFGLPECLLALFAVFPICRITGYFVLHVWGKAVGFIWLSLCCQVF